MEFYCLLFFLSYMSQALSAAPPVEVTPERIILLENKPLEVKCRVGVPITYCRFSVPGVSNALSLRPNLPPHEGIEYSGAGLKEGECGMLIRRVEAKHSGVIHCSMGFTDEPTESTGNLSLIVAKAPDPPLLQVFPGATYEDSFREGEVIQANCRISNARPIANISWYLGSDPIYDGLSPTIKEEENGLMTISQNLTKKVSYVDNGKDLKCVAGHIALGQGSINHSIYKLNIRFPPKPRSQELEKFGFIIGQPGKIVVTFQANPIPNIFWKVDQDNLKEGTRDRTGRFEAGILQHKGAGTWDAILNINSVRAEEVEKRYTLIAQNDLGRESYKVAISTSPEPPADIAAGAIVGIVIAVLVILLLVFMLIFARATGKWCFAGDATRPVGESRFPLRWPGKEINSKKVNSLIYKEYTLVENEEGIKSFVSPENKTRLIVEKKIKSYDEKKDHEKRVGKAKESDSSSGYEIPIEIEKITEKKWWNWKMEKSARKISLPSSDFELCPEEEGKINLPFYMEPLETSSTTSREQEAKGKKRSEVDGDSEEVSTTGGEGPSKGLAAESDFDSSPSFFVADEKEGGDKKKFSLKRFRRKDGQKSKEEEEKEKRPEETTVKELMMESVESVATPAKKSYSLPWTKKNGKTENRQKVKRNSIETPEATIGRQMAAKFSILSWNKSKNATRDESDSRETDGSTAEVKNSNEEEEMENSDKEEEKEDEDKSFVRYEMPEPKPSLFDLINSENSEDLEEPDEVFLEEKTSAEYFDGQADGSKFDEREERKCEEERENRLKRWSHGFQLNRYSSELPKPKGKKVRNAGKIDPNPLKKMFGIRTQKIRVQRIGLIGSGTEEESEDSNQKKGENGEKEERNVIEAISNGYHTEVSRPGFSKGNPRVNESENDSQKEKFSREPVTQQPGRSNLMGQVSVSNSENWASAAESADWLSESERSDTESADHGSTDKSSVSKLTNEKQPKKIVLSGLFGSLKLGKGKGKAADGNDLGRNTAPFETPVKEEEPEEIQVEGSRPEGIVYAELDMARSPGNVMRREDEKTEYAEIMYPPGKMAAERVVDEMRKSRENLVSSRENLAESDEVFTVTVTPDGKKEAAV